MRKGRPTKHDIQFRCRNCNCLRPEGLIGVAKLPLEIGGHVIGEQCYQYCLDKPGCIAAGEAFTGYVVEEFGTGIQLEVGGLIAVDLAKDECEQRRRAKNARFARVYGASGKTVKQVMDQIPESN